MLSDRDNQAPRLSGTDKAVHVYMRLELHSESVDSLVSEVHIVYKQGPTGIEPEIKFVEKE